MQTDTPANGVPVPAPPLIRRVTRTIREETIVEEHLPLVPMPARPTSSPPPKASEPLPRPVAQEARRRASDIDTALLVTAGISARPRTDRRVTAERRTGEAQPTAGALDSAQLHHAFLAARDHWYRRLGKPHPHFNAQLKNWLGEFGLADVLGVFERVRTDALGLSSDERYRHLIHLLAELRAQKGGAKP